MLLLLLRAAAAAHNISTEEERGISFSFLVAAMLLLFTHRQGCAEKEKFGFCFLFDTRTQSMRRDAHWKEYQMVAHLQCYNKKGYIHTWYVYKIFFVIFRLMRCNDVCLFSLSGVLFPRE